MDDDLYKANIYAKANIFEYWILDLQNKEIIVFQNPRNGKYDLKKILHLTKNCKFQLLKNQFLFLRLFDANLSPELVSLLKDIFPITTTNTVRLYRLTNQFQSDVATIVLGEPETAAKTPLPNATENQTELLGRVLDVHIIPSEEKAELDVEPTATKTPFPKVTKFNAETLERVLCVQVTPLGEVAATLLFVATATNTPFP